MSFEIYRQWIDENVKETYGRCYELTLKMQEIFPELIQVRGHYYDFVWGEREHWWLKTEEGQIIDPTKDQFPSKGLGEYIELDKNAKEPIGKCMNCGEYCYDSLYFCSKNCEITVMAEYR